MEKINIAIVGVGQIGRYHLQALRNIDRDILIEVIDSSTESLELINKLNLSSNTIKQLKLSKDISSLSEILDIVIVATNSDVRYEVVKELINKKTIKYLILEKILFQNEEQFYEINELLSKNKIKTWVNCPMRTYSLFKELKKILGESAIIDYHVSGFNLGLGSNAIHHLDLFAFLTGQNKLTINPNNLDEEILPSKRKGFIEFTGTLTGISNYGSRIVITSYSEVKIPPMIQINSSKVRCIIDVSQGKAFITSDEVEFSWKEVSYIQPKQSELTNIFVQQILDTGESELTTFYDSWLIHRPLIKAFLQHLQKKALNEVILCPIT